MGYRVAGHHFGEYVPFDVVLTPAQINSTTNDWNPGALGRRTLIRYTCDSGRALTGIVGGFDQAVICLVSESASSGAVAQCQHEDVRSAAASRFRNGGEVQRSGSAAGAIWYVYDGAISRWQHMGGTS